ncbi:MAG: FAD-dependent oxidoreductase, partial [Bacteroidetes bacterium]|nr:FAD-dependent oxidoreductase [Bacteroidota bacterium]
MGKYDILFEPVQIGPHTAKNRFYQVPHCNGMGYRLPASHAAMREIKAEGGWGVVNTEEMPVHWTCDQAPFIEGQLWDDADIAPNRLMVDAVHKHGALAGGELAYHGGDATNWYSRVPILGPRSMSIWQEFGIAPIHCKKMDKQDIQNVRRWHKQAAYRAKEAGFDIVYVYAETLIYSFLNKRINNRTDEYGGELKNRARLLMELLSDTKDAIGDKCAIAFRLAVTELGEHEDDWNEAQSQDLMGMIGEVPDLWDVNITDWDNDSAVSRFFNEGHQVPLIKFVKGMTTKPVVGVGRYTTPETMVSLVKQGVLDLIGAARPSIADPFMPNKIKEGRIEDIRECIGCNICIIGDWQAVPIRCTQNPTMGEEYRRGWHPEKMNPGKGEKDILIIGAGPAGLEAARGLGARGYNVTLAETERNLGGRVDRESKLLGLSEWVRVADYRITQIEKMDNVTVYPGSPMSAEDIMEVGCEHVFIATGAKWRRDGIGRDIWKPIPGHDSDHVYTPDDIMDGKRPTGKVVIFDNDHYYMGGVLAEELHRDGCEVTIVTDRTIVSAYNKFTLDVG